MKLTVSEYAKRENIAVQTVYKRVKRGGLKTVKENNIIYIVINDYINDNGGLNSLNQKGESGLNSGLNQDDKNHAELLKIIKAQQKEIKRLSKALEKSNKTKENVFLQYITELQQLQLPQARAEVPIEDEIIDVEDEKSKKKARKSKQKKKKKKKHKK